MPNDTLCTEVIYGETSLLRAPGNEPDLVDARKFIGAVIYARYDADPSRFAKPQHPKPAELQDPSIKKHWDLCTTAAREAHAVDVGNCLHYVIWKKDAGGDYPAPGLDGWVYNEKSKITKLYGPFENHGPARGEFHVFRYCGVHV